MGESEGGMATTIVVVEGDGCGGIRSRGMTVVVVVWWSWSY